MKQRYAHIDLSTRTVTDYPIPEALVEAYLGGKTLGARLLYDLTAPGLDPLSPKSVIIVNTGLMTDTGAPCTSRFNLTFKSLLTGGIASSNCGGPFGFMLRRAGFDGLILTGRADVPVTIEASDGAVRIRETPELWGLDAEAVQERLPPGYGKLVIGPAGENLVRYASAVSGERVAGRGGAGAALGAKNIKALIAYGTKRPQVQAPEKFSRYLKKWVRFIKAHPMTGQGLPRYGTGGLVNMANASGALPTHNFQRGSYTHAERICGETLADTLLTRNSGCISCPIRCERRVEHDGREVKGPEYETMGLFGSNIENDDLAFINAVNYHADILGMDTISLAGTLAFAMELKERGIKDFGVEFGKIDNLIDVIYKIARKEGIYAELAEGSKRLSKKYGGTDFAIHAKGMELAAYEPRRSVGMGLGYATSNRGGCHLNGGYLALMESVGVVGMDAQRTKGKAELTVFMQNGMEAVSSAGFCLFTLQTLIPAFLYRMGPASLANRLTGKLLLGVRRILGGMWAILPGGLPVNSLYLFPHCKAIRLATGMKMTTGKLLIAGDRGYTMERLYNLREGLGAKDDALPGRLTHTPQLEGRPDTVVNLQAMLPRYYRVRGWSGQGVPEEKRLRKLGLWPG